jgi:hypothetical protein
VRGAEALAITFGMIIYNHAKTTTIVKFSILLPESMCPIKTHDIFAFPSDILFMDRGIAI